MHVGVSALPRLSFRRVIYVLQRACRSRGRRPGTASQCLFDLDARATHPCSRGSRSTPSDTLPNKYNFAQPVARLPSSSSQPEDPVRSCAAQRNLGALCTLPVVLPCTSRPLELADRCRYAMGFVRDGIRRYMHARSSNRPWATAASPSRYPFLGRGRLQLSGTSSTL